MIEAAFWGLVTAGSLWVGATIATLLRPSRRWIGLAMAFGSGALIAAVAFELVEDAYANDAFLAAAGFVAGAMVFYIGDWIIDRRGGHGRKTSGGEHQLAGSSSAIVLGTVLDGIPESFVLGSSLLRDGAVPIAVVVAVFIANVPEALSATSGLLESGWSGWRAIRMWTVVVAVSVAAAVSGWLFLDAFPGATGAFATAFAGGALIVMLADTLMPEAFTLSGRETGLITALGFAVGFALV